MISEATFPYGDISNLTEDEIDTINTVLESYGEKSPMWLREQTHDEEPWKQARGNLSDDIRSESVVTKDSMGAYYGSI